MIPLLPLTKLDISDSGAVSHKTTIRKRPNPSSQNTSMNSSMNPTNLLNSSLFAPVRSTSHKQKESLTSRHDESKHFSFSSSGAKLPMSKLSPQKGIAVPAETPREVLELPLPASAILKHFKGQLSLYEQGEILNFPDVYYLGKNAERTRTSSSFDDERGDYRTIIGEHICYRYELISPLGRGSFGQVYKAYDHKHSEEVALKIIRNKSRFHRQAVIEVKVLKHLREADAEGRYNVVHLRNYFVFRKHVCIAFELMNINLYDFIKGNQFRGLSVGLVRRFAVQILQCLRLLQKAHIIHCDLKPENILLKQAHRSGIKVIDFGSSCYDNETVYTYIQSRFYRAPEIILGLPYTGAIDMWSFGCILAELYCGFPLFPGESEHDQLLCIMEVKGLPPDELMAKATRRKMFFDSNLKPIVKPNSKGKVRLPNSKHLSEVIRCSDAAFLDFLNRALDWVPENRLTPEEAFRHCWLAEALQKSGDSSQITPRQRSVQPAMQAFLRTKENHKTKFSLGEVDPTMTSYVNIKKLPHSTRNTDSRGFVF
jgi:dual specificity tyrosine-phosphorylation-regulated kinase 2/3/4